MSNVQPTIVNWVKNSVGLGAAVTATALAAGAIAPVIGIPLVAAWLATQSWIEGRKERDSAQQLQRIETWLKKLVRKHGTLQDAVEAIRDGQEKHKGIDTGRAALIADVLAGRLTNIEAAIRENESLLVYGFEQLAQRIEGSADAIVAFEERFKTDFDSFKSTVVSRLDFIKDDTGSLVTGQEEINRKLDELLADKRAGEDPAQRTLTPEQEALVDAALAQGDAETKAKAAIAKRDFATAKKYLAEAMTPVLGKAFDLLTTQGDLHYFQGSFDEAIEPYDKALTLRPNNPAAMRNLALALQQAHLGSIADNVKRAISIHERILGAAEPHSPQWAMTQNNLGNALSELPTGDRGEHLARAIEAYEAALTVRTREQFPTDWAMTQNNLGNALQELPTGDRSEHLARAIRAYEAALTVYTRERFPAHWATMQNNLGTALSELPTGDRGENLARAIEAYEATLTVYTREQFPAKWAGTQNNLGNALKELPTGDRSENLTRAIEACEAALTVWTREQFPHYNAIAEENLLAIRSELRQATAGE